MVLGDHQRREAQNIRQQNEFLALPGGHVPHGREKRNAIEPFRFGQFDLAGEVVQMLHQ